MNTNKKTGLFLAVVALASCSDPVGTPEDVGAVTGLVVIGSVPAPNVQVALDGSTVRSTDASGKYRFVDLTVGDSYGVAVVAATLPEHVEMHVAEHQVTVPESRVAYANFFGSRKQP